MITVVILSLFAVLLLLRVPVVMSMLFASLVVLVAQGEVPLVVVPQFIDAVATVMSWIITRDQSAMQIAQWMGGLTDNLISDIESLR